MDPEAPAGPSPEAAPESVAPAPRLAGRQITLCVTGSIAAFKAVNLLRLLQREGADVEVVLTRGAREFVGAATFSGLTGKRVHQDMFDASAPGELHVELAGRSELVLIVPATADVLARLASGRADDLLGALALSARCPVLAAPAMHPDMWSHPAMQRSRALLDADGRVDLVGPVAGEVASGAIGIGRMAEPEAILEQALLRLGPRPLAGHRVLVTAGPTEEALDPVRYLGNRSSGKMGFALAGAAARLGAVTTLIAGPVSLTTPPGVRRIDIVSATNLRAALWQCLGEDAAGTDALIMAAAVADYRPAEARASKLKRGQSLVLELVPNPDLLAEVGRRRNGQRPLLVGFALETAQGDELISLARAKLEHKRVDLVVANSADEGLGGEATRVDLVSASDHRSLGPFGKEQAARAILEWVSQHLNGG